MKKRAVTLSPALSHVCLLAFTLRKGTTPATEKDLHAGTDLALAAVVPCVGTCVANRKNTSLRASGLTPSTLFCDSREPPNSMEMVPGGQTGMCALACVGLFCSTADTPRCLSTCTGTEADKFDKRFHRLRPDRIVVVPLCCGNGVGQSYTSLLKMENEPYMYIYMYKRENNEVALLREDHTALPAQYSMTPRHPHLCCITVGEGVSEKKRETHMEPPAAITGALSLTPAYAYGLFPLQPSPAREVHLATTPFSLGNLLRGSFFFYLLFFLPAPLR